MMDKVTSVVKGVAVVKYSLHKRLAGDKCVGPTYDDGTIIVPETITLAELRTQLETAKKPGWEVEDIRITWPD